MHISPSDIDAEYDWALNETAYSQVLKPKESPENVNKSSNNSQNYALVQHISVEAV